MSFTCKTCTATFTSRSNFNVHNKSAKYCINMRKVREENRSNICEICDHEYSNQSSLHRHLLVCSTHVGYMKLKDINLELSSKVNQLQEIKLIYERQLAEKDVLIQTLSLKAIERPTTINNTNSSTNTTNILNLSLFSPDELVKSLQDDPMDKDILNRGVVGVAQWVGSKMKRNGKPTYMIADASRHKFSYKDDEGVHTDYQASKVIKTVAPIVHDQATDILNQTNEYFDIASKIYKLTQNDIPEIKKAIIKNESRLNYLQENKLDYSKLSQLLEEQNFEYSELVSELESLKKTAFTRNIPIHRPLDFLAEDLSTTTDNYLMVKNLTEHKAPFSSELLKII